MAAVAPSSPASHATSTTDTSKGVAQRVDIRAGRPIPLTAGQEAEVRELYYKRVRSYCADEIREFAHCAAGRTFTIPIVCRQQRFRMNDCMNAHASREEEDKAREEWFRTLPERKQAKEEDERWKKEQLRKKREWWGVDAQGKPLAQTEERRGP